VRGAFISDCEGPISKNDNAYELVTKFIPDGDRFFCNVSKYDDVLADVFRKPSYTAGSTLKLVLPFLKAYGVTDRQMEDFSVENIMLISDTKNALKHIRSIVDCYIVSTSYEHYIRALCGATCFPYENTYCTKVSLDSIPITVQEREVLCKRAREISQMPPITIPVGVKDLTDFSLKDQSLIGRLGEIFWCEFAQLPVCKFFSEVITVGGAQKAWAICDVVERLKIPFESVLYVGDSITDVEALRLVRDRGGLAVSFNGNSYAVKNADVAVLSKSNLVAAAIADVFYRFGREKTLRLIESWSESSLKGCGVDLGLVEQVFGCEEEPKVQIVTSENMNLLVTESSGFRKKVRGVAIGRLG